MSQPPIEPSSTVGQSLVLRAATFSPEDTRSLAAALADHVGDGDLIVLSGDLGAGKTCFSQGFGAGLGVTERITSPTFTLHNQYEGRLRFNHLDVYRLDDIEETLDLDLPEMLESGVTLIEWGEEISPTLPADHLLVRLLLGPPEQDVDFRHIELAAGGETWAARLRQISLVLTDWIKEC